MLTNRQLQKKKTAEMLYQAAVELIQENGYENTTVSSITKRAGVSTGTFYVHFKSKEDIVREIFFSDYEKLITTKFPAFLKEHPEASVAEKITYFLWLKIPFVMEKGIDVTTLTYMTFFSEAMDKTKPLKEWTMLATLQELLLEAEEKHLLKADYTAEAAFEILYSAIRGNVITWILTRGHFDLEARTKTALHLMLQELFTT